MPESPTALAEAASADPQVDTLKVTADAAPTRTVERRVNADPEMRIKDKSKRRLVWLDLEMTGLEEQHVIIEIATVVTDAELNVLAEGPDIAINRAVHDLNNIDDWSLQHHTDSGLLAKVRASRIGVNEAEAATLAFVKQWVGKWEAPLCGNSIFVDRLFLKREMPRLEAYLHYRIIDVSSLKELYRRWYPEIPKPPDKEKTHRALDDIYESIAELRWYREKIFR